jgi:hypothetical protein
MLGKDFVKWFLSPQRRSGSLWGNIVFICCSAFEHLVESVSCNNTWLCALLFHILLTIMGLIWFGLFRQDCLIMFY